jgi:eukaryotic-like serine/threonine-protein kinase
MSTPAESAPTSRDRSIGGYRVQRRLGIGGMGEVYLAAAAGPEGVERPVAIKLIRHLHQQRKDFIEMFIEEAKVSFLLTHPNIVQTYEIGQVDGHHFLVLEYVDGTNLEELLAFFAASVGQPLPAAFGLYIGAQVARGLEYAHGLSDQQGRALKIVHRDVSPGNVLLSKDGQVKVTDFGLAKSELRRVESVAGQIKGKLAYMAPEQFRGQAVDVRADVYSLGLVLYEALSGQHPFGTLETITLATRAKPLSVAPLAEAAPHLDPAVVALVERCIAEEPEERFGSARELGREIDRCMRELGLTVADYELAEFIARARAEAVARPLAPHPFDQALGMELRKVEGQGGTVASSFMRVPSEEGTPGSVSVSASVLASPPVLADQPLSATLPPIVQRSRRPLIVALALLACGLALGAAWWLRGGGPASTAGQDAAGTVAPDARSVVTLQADAAPASAPARTGTLNVRPVPAGGAVRVAGLGRGTAPLSIKGLPTGVALRVQIDLPGHAPYDQQVTLEPGAELTMQPRLTPARPGRPKVKPRRYGALSVNSEPWSVVYVDGVKVRNTPLVRHRLRAGRHHVRLVNAGRKLSAVRRVQIKPDKETQLSVKLGR